MTLREINDKYTNEYAVMLDREELEFVHSTEDLKIVYGYGSDSASYVLIGEAPGKDEVKLGRPFVGKAGKILDEFLDLSGLKREDIYITNTVKYRLSKTGSREGTLKNRPCSKTEILQGINFLHDELIAIKPKSVVTLGNVPLKAMNIIKKTYCSNLDSGCDINEIGICHGKSYLCKEKEITYTHIPLYHPASVIYNRSLKAVYESDVSSLRS